jgi:hypothetical protein
MDQKTQATATFLSWLQPTRAPYHIMAISAIVALTALASFQLIDTRWEMVFLMNGFVLFISIFLAIIPQEINEEDYEKQLRLARCIGIASATICFTFAENPLNSWLYMRIIGIAGVQILLFSVYMLISVFKKEDKNRLHSKKTNNLQLSLITTSLLVGIFINSVKSVDSYDGKDISVFCLLFIAWLLCTFVWFKQLLASLEISFNIDKMPE